MDQTVKVHIVSVDVSRTVSSSLGPALRHPVRSRILLPRLRTIGKWRFLLPRPFATTFDLDLGPSHWAPSSDGASFFISRSWPPPPAAPTARRTPPPHRQNLSRAPCMAGVPTSRLFAAKPPWIVVITRSRPSSSLAASHGSPASASRPLGPAHPLERGLFVCPRATPARHFLPTGIAALRNPQHFRALALARPVHSLM